MVSFSLEFNVTIRPISPCSTAFFTLTNGMFQRFSAYHAFDFDLQLLQACLALRRRGKRFSTKIWIFSCLIIISQWVKSELPQLHHPNSPLNHFRVIQIPINTVLSCTSPKVDCIARLLQPVGLRRFLYCISIHISWFPCLYPIYHTIILHVLYNSINKYYNYVKLKPNYQYWSYRP